MIPDFEENYLVNTLLVRTQIELFNMGGKEDVESK
jgi:hypothetical protein